MPIGPNNVQARHALIERTCYEIDQILLDHEKAKANVRGNPKDYFHSFVYNGVLSQAEKETLIALYTAVGWEKVTVTNSHELNQPPGRYLINLYRWANSEYLPK